jgi:Domain of unknown function (DUF4440)
MIRRLITVLAVLASIVAPAGAQVASVRLHVWKVAWKDAFRFDGTSMRIPVFSVGEPLPSGVRVIASPPPEVSAIVQIDEQYRLARVARNAAQATDFVSEDFSGTDTDGTRIDRSALVNSIVTSGITAINTKALEYRLAASAVIVRGEEEIIAKNGRHPTMFTRVYSREPQTHDWRLITSTERPVRN